MKKNQRTRQAKRKTDQPAVSQAEDLTKEAQAIVGQVSQPDLTEAEARYSRGQLLTIQLRQARQGKRSQIIRDVAAKLQIEATVLRADARFALAADTLIKNHGLTARKLMFGPDARLPARKVGEISRMAMPRQRAELESYARSGRAFRRASNYADLVDQLYPRAMKMIESGNSIRGKTIEALPPLDTERFSEVISRLVRAGGMLAKNIIEIPRLSKVVLSSEERRRICALANQIISHGRLLLHLVEARECAHPQQKGGVK